MVSGDPLRTPTVVSWNEANAFTQTGGGAAVSINPAFAWQHGGIQPEIATTWLGLVGPGVKNLGIDKTTWTDHTDVRPTILALVGLKDDYVHDGRVIVEQLHDSALPASLQANTRSYQLLATAYKQLNAPFGELSMASIKLSTAHVKSTDEKAYGAYLQEMKDFTEERDELASAIKTVLDGAAFGQEPVKQGTAASLAAHADALVKRMEQVVKTRTTAQAGN
jgi:hypothetical protein